jgi:2-polyprenyl-3-methyl-5-hydroxy-6-metoxy-1,4-benzoquinol methylase
MAANAWNNRDGIELRQCNACDFAFSAQASVSYEEFFVKAFSGASKDELMQAARSEGLDRMVAEIAIKGRLSAGARVLDFGSGVGLAALSFAGAGFDVTAVEASKPYVEVHKTLGLRSFPSIAEARHDRGLFDLVVMKDVLEHVTSPREILKSVLECVKPGGYFYIRVPNAHAYRFIPAVDTISHVNHFTPRSVTQLVAESAMEKIDFVGVYDISSRAGRLYHGLFWRTRRFLPLYHQISLLFRRTQGS